MEKKDFQQLADKIYTGQATEQEIALYNAYLNKFLKEEPLEELANETLQKQELLDRIYSKIEPAEQTWKLKTWYRVAAAVFLGISSYFIYQGNIKNKLAKQNEELAVVKEIYPGKEKALLQLSNGEEILLDDIANGDSFVKKGIKISKTTKGELVYDLSESGFSDSDMHTLNTPRGGRFTVVLPDKSIVTLNSESSISFPTKFTHTKREVVLSGEAYFDVATNKAVPFYVHVKGTTIEVLGTSFNINSYRADEIKTSLFEGAVKVNFGKAAKTIKPYQQASVNLVKRDIAVAAFEGDADLAWRNDLFVFNNESLEDMMTKISRWYDVDVIYQGDVKDNYFGGRYSMKNTLSELLKSIELTGAVHFKIEERRIIVMP